MNPHYLLKRVAVVALLLALAGSPLFAGVVFEVETTYHSGSRGPESSQMSVEGKNLKMEIASGQDGSASDQGEAIFRGDRREMVIVDHGDKSYMTMDTETVAELGGEVQGQMQQAMKEMQKHLDQLDPEQRAMAEKMLKGKLGDAMQGATDGGAQRPKPEFRRTSERASKQGYPCVKYEVLQEGQKIQELWITDWNNVKGGKEVMGAFREMSSFFEEMMDSLSETLGGLGNFFDATSPIESFAKIDGFPVVTRSFEGGELESETVLQSVTERDLDPDAFEPPKGYRLRSMGL